MFVTGRRGNAPAWTRWRPCATPSPAVTRRVGRSRCSVLWPVDHRRSRVARCGPGDRPRVSVSDACLGCGEMTAFATGRRARHPGPSRGPRREVASRTACLHLGRASTFESRQDRVRPATVDDRVCHVGACQPVTLPRSAGGRCSPRSRCVGRSARATAAACSPRRGHRGGAPSTRQSLPEHLLTQLGALATLALGSYETSWRVSPLRHRPGRSPTGVGVAHPALPGNAHANRASARHCFPIGPNVGCVRRRRRRAAARRGGVVAACPRRRIERHTAG